MRSFSVFALRVTAAMMALAAAVSCGKRAVIDGVIEDAPSSELIVKLLDINRFEVLDTIQADSRGRYSYRIDIEKGQPEFVYLFHGDTKVASLLLEAGDHVKVTSDTVGVFSVSGSEESVKLAGVEKDFAEFTGTFTGLVARLDSLDQDSPEAEQVKRDMGRIYTEYYRSRVKYVIENPYSMTVIPVLYQVIGDNLPVFSQDTDAMHFRNACDSLETVYPDSRYVKSLGSEAKRRSDLLELRVRLQNAEEIPFPDIDLTDRNAVRHRLSDVDAKVVMVHFWTSASAEQKMFNLDVLKPVYEDYHDRGFEIYQVALDADKAGWARTVKDQGLEWINVCDVLGSASQAAVAYNVSSLPVSFFISDGDLVDVKVTDEASLRKFLDALL